MLFLFAGWIYVEPRRNLPWPINKVKSSETTSFGNAQYEPWYNKEQLQNKTPEKENNQFKSIYQVRLLPQIAFENYMSQFFSFAVAVVVVCVKQWPSKFYPRPPNNRQAYRFSTHLLPNAFQCDRTMKCTSSTITTAIDQRLASTLRSHHMIFTINDYYIKFNLVFMRTIASICSSNVT